MMLKWRYMRTLVLLVTVILGMSIIFIYLSVRRATPSEAEKTGFIPYAGPIPGQEVSLTQAQASLPFKIQLPTSLGTPVLIKVLLPPQTDTPAVTIIYAAHKPSSDATGDDVLGQDGIGLFEAANAMTLKDSALNIRGAINSTKNVNDPSGGLQEVNINGYVGCAGGNQFHCVGWYTETTYYRLEANVNYPLQQLIQIAQSIPVN